MAPTDLLPKMTVAADTVSVMPLVAELDGHRIESWRLGPEAWSALKQSYRSSTLTMPCGLTAVPKVSNLGTQFFAHASGTACELHVGADESPEHLSAKELVAEAARAGGWQATVEFAGPNRSWIADVLVERDGRRIAVEIQLSAQDEHELKRRTRHYLEAGLEVIWLLGPRNKARRRELERNCIDAHVMVPDLGAQELGLPTLLEDRDEFQDFDAGVRMLLGGAIAKRIQVVVSRVGVDTEMKQCWRPECGKWFTRWHVDSLDMTSRCGSVARLENSIGYRNHAASRFEQLTTVQETIRPLIGASDLPAPTRYGFRRSKPVPDGYIAQLCPHCGVLQGDGMDNPGGRRRVYDLPVWTFMPIENDLLDRPHVCGEIGPGKCEQTQQFDGPAFGIGGYVTMREVHASSEPLPAKGYGTHRSLR